MRHDTLCSGWARIDDEAVWLSVMELRWNPFRGCPRDASDVDHYASVMHPDGSMREFFGIAAQILFKEHSGTLQSLET